ncbi:MAG TPA: DUF5691 domain-containing protein [Acidimicrobiales bacterium]
MTPTPSTPSTSVPAAVSASALWDRLVSVALVGTERKPLPPDLVAGVAALLGDDGIAGPGSGAAHGDDRSPRAEDAVLTAAAALATYRRVGLVPAPGVPELPEPAPVDERRPVSTTAAQLLGLLLEGQVRVLGGPGPLLEDWLRRCAATGRRPPAALLPALLDHATRVRGLRPAVRAAGGGPLAWLAARNPDWAWAAPTGDDGAGGAPEPVDRPPDEGDDVWRTGRIGERLAWLAERRATDPDAARRAVEATWPGESAADRAKIVAALRTGLDPADEPFLEAALDDRAAAVRAAAADLLARLPGSALAARMADRARALVEPGRRGRPPTVTLPETVDAATRRDGVVDAGAPPGMGRRTWWFVQIVGAAPLSCWEGMPVEGAPPELLAGWVRAAGRQGDPEWCRALLRAAPDPQLLAALPAEEARRLLPVALEHAADTALAGLLAATPGPWDEPLSRWVVERLRHGTRHAAAVDRALTGLAAAADVGIIADLQRWIDELALHDRRRATLSHVVHTLSIRHAIAQELA